MTDKRLHRSRLYQPAYSSWIVIAFAGLMICTRTYAADVVEYRYADPASFMRCTHDRFITLADDPAGIRLVRTWLLTNERGITSKHPFRLSDTHHARVEFELELRPAHTAELYIFRGGGTPKAPMHIVVNGHRVEHTESGLAAGRGWRRQPVPSDWLHAGVNQVVFSGTGTLVDDVRSPHRSSAVSYDAGQSWHPADGEFIVRLRLYDYAPAGHVTSEVIDTGRLLAPTQQIGPFPRARRIRLMADDDTPRHTGIEYEHRCGSTPFFHPQHWTPWQQGDAFEPEGQRYVQWRATLKSRDPSRTPLIRSLTVRVEPDPDTPKTIPWIERLTVVQFDRPEHCAGSYPFTYEQDTPRVRYLRERYGLAKLLEPGSSDIETTTRIRHWVSRQWKNGWNIGTYRYIPPWDTLQLLEMAPPNLCLGMCTHYATAYVQTSVSLGFVSRHVILDHHCVAESYLDGLATWTIQDPGPGAGPEGYPIGVRFEQDGAPLSALDLHCAWKTQAPVMAVPVPEDGDPHPYATEKGLALALYRRFAIPLRNNHLSVPEPAEVEHGQDHYHFDGYLWWTDNVDSPDETVRCFSLLSNREADFYPSVDRVHLDLQAQAEGVVKVLLTSSVPHPQGYEVSLDDTPWSGVETGFTWPLHAGTNRLAARAVNDFGRKTAVTRAVILMPDAP